MRFLKSLFVIFLILYSHSPILAQKALIDKSALNNPKIDLSILTVAESRALIAGVSVAVKLEGSNIVIGTFLIDSNGRITFNFPKGMKDPIQGNFIFDIGAGAVLSNPGLSTNARTVIVPFTSTTSRPFVYTIIFQYKAQTKGAFAVSGKSTS